MTTPSLNWTAIIEVCHTVLSASVRENQPVHATYTKVDLAGLELRDIDVVHVAVLRVREKDERRHRNTVMEG